MTVSAASKADITTTESTDLLGKICIAISVIVRPFKRNYLNQWICRHPKIPSGWLLDMATCSLSRFGQVISFILKSIRTSCQWEVSTLISRMRMVTLSCYDHIKFRNLIIDMHRFLEFISTLFRIFSSSQA